eukprot:jgi/Galph1/965/GphlegSOOS_G5688.1
MNESAAINLLLDDETELRHSNSSLMEVEDNIFSTPYRNYQKNKRDKYSKTVEASEVVEIVEDEDEDIVLVDSWPKKLGQVILRGFLTVNYNMPLLHGQAVTFGVTFPQGESVNSSSIRLLGLEIGRLLGQVTKCLAPLLFANFIRISGHVINSSSCLKRNEHITIQASIFVNKEAFDADLSPGTKILKIEPACCFSREILQQNVVELIPYLNVSFVNNLSQSDNIENVSECNSIPEVCYLRKKGLLTELRPYQEDAVKWMVFRENAFSSQKISNPLWEKCQTPEGFGFYINFATSELSLNEPNSGTTVQGGILADEMGLGKTIETIAAIVENSPVRSERQRLGQFGTLIIVPLSLLSQWLEEIYTHVEDNFLDVTTFYGPSKSHGDIELSKFDIVLTTYGTICSEFNEKRRQSSPLFSVDWYRVVLDEAHTIKERTTQTAKACYSLRAQCRWLLTGTPIQNSLEDFFSFLHFLKVHPFSEYKFWNEHIMKPFSSNHDSYRKTRAEKGIQKLVKSLLLRRTKQTIGEDGEPIVHLPNRIVNICRLEPFDEEKKVYDSLYAQSKSMFDLLMSENRLLANFATVLEFILRLRQCCNHVDLVLKSSSVRLLDLSDADKFTKTMEHLFINSDHKKSLQSNEYISTVIERLKHTCMRGDNIECPICLDTVDEGVVFGTCGHVTCKECILAMLQGQSSILCPLCRVPVMKSAVIPLPTKNFFPDNISNNNLLSWQKSCKIVALIKELKLIQQCRMGHGTYEELNTVGKTVIFSQWTSFLDILEVALSDNGLKYYRLDGRLTRSERAKILSDFKKEPTANTKDCDILLVSLKAGGVGLNLTVASQVFLMDPWWNPAVEEQAIDRVHRIGQFRTVIVKRFIVSNSIEENLLEVQNRKKSLACKALEGAGTSKEKKKQITIEDLITIFRT